ncbi:unnamed protein product [Dicrocoelium dendriticum]|nr:unnamed protein product [Dicrocoelium dendriticum]
MAHKVTNEYSQKMVDVSVQQFDMDSNMVNETTKRAGELYKEFTSPRKVASALKQECDKKYGRAWNCITGRDFTSYVSYQKGMFLEFMIGDYNFILFKSGDK